jgi:quercetin dioxygenase-like cupin family protein
VPRAAAPTPDQPVVREDRLDVVLPGGRSTGRVVGREIRILAGQAAGVHVHNGPVFGHIVEGSAVYQVEGGVASVLVAGDAFYEPADTRIARFDGGADGVTFFAYFLLGAGEEPELRMC